MLPGKEHKVVSRGVLDRGEFGGDGAGLVEFAVLIDKTEWYGIDSDEDILSKAIELLAERPGVPFRVGEVAVVRRGPLILAKKVRPLVLSTIFLMSPTYSVSL